MLRGDEQGRIVAAYVAICTGDADHLKQQYPLEWSRAITDLQSHKRFVRNLFSARIPGAERWQLDAKKAGLKPPARK
jgi:hypothetical protein